MSFVFHAARCPLRIVQNLLHDFIQMVASTSSPRECTKVDALSYLWTFGFPELWGAKLAETGRLVSRTTIGIAFHRSLIWKCRFLDLYFHMFHLFISWRPWSSDKVSNAVWLEDSSCESIFGRPSCISVVLRDPSYSDRSILVKEGMMNCEDIYGGISRKGWHAKKTYWSCRPLVLFLIESPNVSVQMQAACFGNFAHFILL